MKRSLFTTLACVLFSGLFLGRGSIADVEGEKMRKACFAAGCFWGVEAAFRDLPGVVDTKVGYTGGDTENPSYEQVCRDQTGHAEAVEIIYNPEKISYEQLLACFWKTHDPTQWRRQGPDVGSQYRSAIFYHGDEQRRLAAASREQEEKSGRWKKPIVTEIVPAAEFYLAEEYHQQYFEKNGRACHW